MWTGHRQRILHLRWGGQQLLKWEADEKRGMDVKTPSEQFKWNQLGDLYQWFTDTYAHLSLAELKGKLCENIVAIQTMIDSMCEDELFQQNSTLGAAISGW